MTPVRQSQAWYPKALQIKIINPILIHRTKDVILNLETQKHPLITNKTLQLVAWVVSGKSFLQTDYQI